MTLASAPWPRCTVCGFRPLRPKIARRDRGFARRGRSYQGLQWLVDAVLGGDSQPLANADWRTGLCPNGRNDLDGIRLRVGDHAQPLPLLVVALGERLIFRGERGKPEARAVAQAARMAAMTSIARARDKPRRGACKSVAAKASSTQTVSAQPTARSPSRARSRECVPLVSIFSAKSPGCSAAKAVSRSAVLRLRRRRGI